MDSGIQAVRGVHPQSPHVVQTLKMPTPTLHQPAENAACEKGTMPTLEVNPNNERPTNMARGDSCSSGGPDQTAGWPLPSWESDHDLDSDTDYTDSSFIEDYDDSCSDWEDEYDDDDSFMSSAASDYFQRVECRPANPPGPSLLTSQLLHAKARSENLRKRASQHAPGMTHGQGSASGSACRGPPGGAQGAPPATREDAHASTGTQPTAIPATGPDHGPFTPPLSPQTTRRRMVATEMPRYLRQSIIWERSQTSLAARAVLWRQHPRFWKDNVAPNAIMESGSLCEEFYSGYHTRGW